MNRLPRLVPFAVAALSTLLLAGCGGSGTASGDRSPGSAADVAARTPHVTTLHFKLTDAGCEPHDAEAPAGPITFDVENPGTSLVTELEVMEDETILSEKENIGKGLSGSFSLELEAGEYVLHCNNGSHERGTLTVTGGPGATVDPQSEAAVRRYRDYLEANTAELVARTKPFVAAVLAGDVAVAKALYPTARVPYERIEPVAESFGDLDPRIDARADTVPASEFEGFHRLEKALWAEGSAKGMAPVARQLLADVEELRVKVKTADVQAAQVANGANELLSEVSTSKITGEEERYSHLDLVDFLANVEGSQAAFEAIRPLLDGTTAKLTEEVVEADFAKVRLALGPFRRGDAFIPYTELTETDTRTLAQLIDALAEKLSQVPAEIVGGELRLTEETSAQDLEHD